MERKVFCVHCGYEIGYTAESEESRASAVADMTKHELVCPENPAAAVIARLQSSLAEAVEYLDRNDLNSICSGSLLHQAMREALREPA